MNDSKDQKPLPKDPVINPEDEKDESQTSGEEGDGDGDDEEEGGVEVPKKGPPPQP